HAQSSEWLPGLRRRQPGCRLRFWLQRLGLGGIWLLSWALEKRPGHVQPFFPGDFQCYEVLFSNVQNKGQPQAEGEKLPKRVSEATKQLYLWSNIPFSMRFIANSSVLSKKLSHLAGLISANPMQPIISTLLFELKEQKRFITASNMHTTLRVEMEVQEVQEPVDICIPARILIDYLKNLSDQPLSFHVHLDTMSVDITSDSGKYRVGAQDAGEFPKEVDLEDPLQLSVPSEFLQYGLRKTIFAVSKDDVRPAMTGVFFELRNDEMCLVSTDSQRLIQVRNKNISFAQESGFTVPKKPAELLLDLISGSDSTMEVKVDARSVVFYGDQYRLSARLVEMAFPPYRTVIPTENPYTLQINRLEFL